MKRALWAWVLILFALANAVAAQVTVDGDLTDLIAVAQGSQADPINEIIPTCKSGFDLANVYVYYDPNSDELYVGLDLMDVPPGVGVNGPGVPGDADGDNDPSFAGNPACPEVKTDQFGVGADETYLVRIDTDNDGSFDTANDLRIEYRNNTLNVVRGDGSPGPGGLTSQIVLGVAGALVDPGMPNQNLATEDIEILVGNYSLIDTVPLCFRLTTFSGSLVDIPPEDVLNQAISVDITDPEVDVTLEGRNLTQGGVFGQSDIPAADGEIVEFRLTIENTGNAPLDPTQLRHTLPSELTFDAGSVVGTSNFSVAGAQIIFRELDGDKNIDPGDIRIVTFQAAVGVIATVALNTLDGGGPGPIECVSAPAQDSDTLGVSGVAIECIKEVSLDGINFSASVTASPGQRVQFRVTINNPSGIPIDNVIVSDVLPAGLGDPQTTDPDCGFVGQTLTCTIAQIASLGQATILYDARVDATSGPLLNTVVVLGDAGGTQVNDICGATVQVNTPCIVCIQEVSLDGVNFFPTVTADIGQILTFRTMIQNCGDAALFLATYNTTLPTGYANLVSLDGRCIAAGSTLSCADIGPIAAAGSTEVRFQATVANASGPFLTTIDVVGTPGTVANSGTTVNSQCNVTITLNTPCIVCVQEVSLDAINYTPTVTADIGQDVNFRITVTNCGDANLFTGDLTATLPTGFSNLVSLDGRCTPSGLVLNCGEIGPLAPAASTQIEFVATTTSAGTKVTDIDVSGTPGTVSFPGSPVTSECDVTVIVRPCGLVCIKEVSTDGLSYGSSITRQDGESAFFRVTVTNTAPAGGCTFDDVDLTDVLPAELTFVGFDSPPAGADVCAYDLPTKTISCTFFTVAPGESRMFVYSTLVDAGGGNATVTNAVSVSGDTGTPSNPGQTFASTCDATVVIENEEEPIPTLSEWGMILLLMGFGLLLARKKL